MPILPALQPIVDAISAAGPPPPTTTMVELRSRVNDGLTMTNELLVNPVAPLESEVDYGIPVAEGVIAARVYRPNVPAGLLPVHVYFHGGGFWAGDLEHFDYICRGLAIDAECLVVSVAYRLAPEHKFPIAAEDCYASLLWVADQAELLGGDSDRISVGGGSSGGGLAATVALMARDRQGPSLQLQVLEIPVTDLTMSQPSIEENAAGPSLTKEAIADYVQRYLDDPDDAYNGYASPLLAEDVSGLPPALVMTCEFDPLRDEGEAYARRLCEAGVSVQHHRWDGQYHGSHRLSKVIPAEAAEYQRTVTAALRKAFGTPLNH
jgi:acetyl esterase